MPERPSESIVPPARRSAFTLVEMLVVTLLIVILLALLMPMASAAKRQANAVKCLAHLRDIGLAFQYYEAEHRGVWPVAVHTNANRAQPDRYWTNFLEPYLNRPDPVAVRTISERSVLRGCPEWADARESLRADKKRVGYGMQYYPSFFSDQDRYKLAYVVPIVSRAGTFTVGQYARTSKWRHAAERRGLLADSISLGLGMPTGRITERTLAFYPYDGDGAGRPPGYFHVDATRHAAPGTSREKVLKTRSVNMLFCDGHADRVTVLEAYNAIRNPGDDAFRKLAHVNNNPY